jgi:hypothetical protein
VTGPFPSRATEVPYLALQRAVDGLRSWKLAIPGELVSLNAERSAHWSARSRGSQQWRADAKVLGKALGTGCLDQVSVAATPWQAKGKLADAGNHLPSVKAAIDGLVDAGIIPDDSPAHLRTLTMHAPKRSTWRRGGALVDWLEVTITEEEA